MTAWFVAFGDDGSRLKWWDVFTRRGFRHCFAFRYDLAADCWIVFDPAFSGVSVRVFANDAFTIYISGLSESLNRIVRCELPDNRRVLPRFAGWCAPMCADVVRFRGVALTPRQLYCSLQRNGAEPAFEGVCRYGRDFLPAEDAET
jgi:hypothetical protein